MVDPAFESDEVKLDLYNVQSLERFKTEKVKLFFTVQTPHYIFNEVSLISLHYGKVELKWPQLRFLDKSSLVAGAIFLTSQDSLLPPRFCPTMLF